MDYIQSPVVGDPVYGNFSNLPKPLREAAKRFGRQALHAAELAIAHPVTGQALNFRAEIPADMAELIGVFRAERA
jgi:23S rRNA pseudouridine1911/1915/1917 synthase